jgi:hypothetical protein
MMEGMTKRRATITVDPDKVDEANRLTGSDNFSQTVDKALDALIRQERLRQDVEAYARIPQERGLGRDSLLVPADLDDDTDWTEEAS